MARAIVLVAPLQGWCAPLEETPDAVFAGRMLGDGVLIDPIDNVVRALCDDRPEGAGPESTMIPLARVEWEHIQQALAETQGNISAAARLLGTHRRSLQRKLARRPGPERTENGED